MTLIMVWKEFGAERVWMISDSRLTNQMEQGYARLTDHAAKILEAPVTLNQLQPNLPPICSGTLGFAYAGSSLVALQAYAAVLPLWSRLQSSAGQVPPTVKECAEHLGTFVAAYSHEVAGSGADGKCQCVLLGYNKEFGALQCCSIKTKLSVAGMAVDIEELELARPDTLFMFGSGKAAATQGLASIPRSGSVWKREPLEWIRQSLRRDDAEDIGGGVQIGIASSEGFELCFDVQPARIGQFAAGDPLVNWKYRGFNFAEVGRVGTAFATLRGLAG